MAASTETDMTQMPSPSRFLVVALSLACACASSGQRYLDATMDFGSVRTVAVMPFANLTRDQPAAERVRDVFANMLLATGTLSVLPPGEVQAAITKTGLQSPSTPSAEEAVKIGKALKADAIITGTVREYGEVRSGTTSGNVISVGAQMIETGSGKLVWSASTTKGGISMADRLLGSSGAPMNEVTEIAVADLLDKLLK
jgi:hypothetical protein